MPTRDTPGGRFYPTDEYATPEEWAQAWAQSVTSGQPRTHPSLLDHPDADWALKYGWTPLDALVLERDPSRDFTFSGYHWFKWVDKPGALTSNETQLHSIRPEPNNIEWMHTVSGEGMGQFHFKVHPSLYDAVNAERDHNYQGYQDKPPPAHWFQDTEKYYNFDDDDLIRVEMEDPNGTQ